MRSEYEEGCEDSHQLWVWYQLMLTLGLMADLTCDWVHFPSIRKKSLLPLHWAWWAIAVPFLIGPRPANIKGGSLWTGPVCALPDDTLHFLFYLQSAFLSLDPPLIFPSACPLPFCTACQMCRCFTVLFLCSETWHGWSSCLKQSIIDRPLLVANAISSGEPNPPSHATHTHTPQTANWHWINVETASLMTLKQRWFCSSN